MFSIRVWLTVSFSLLLISCVQSQSSIETAVFQTMQISQLETAAAIANQATTQPIATQAPATETQASPKTSAPAELAPDPLPAFNTGFVLNNGECFNFDNAQVSASDGECDVWLSQPALFTQMNGAKISGYVTVDAPSRTHCIEARYETGDLAVQTDLYLCFTSNEGRVGFIVVRDYLGAVPMTGIVFDYWVFDGF